MTPKPAFLFDLDGTLADTLPDLVASANYVRKKHGLEPVNDLVIRSFIGDGARTLIRRALQDVRPDDAAVAEAFELYLGHHQEQCTKQARLFPGVMEYLTELRQRGHSIAVVTNKPEQFAIPVIEHLGLNEFTSVVVGGDTLKSKKPDPAMLRHALERLGCSTQGATMVGDGLQDLRAGKALGLRTIACLFGYSEPATLRAEGADVFWTTFANHA